MQQKYQRECKSASTCRWYSLFDFHQSTHFTRKASSSQATADPRLLRACSQNHLTCFHSEIKFTASRNTNGKVCSNANNFLIPPRHQLKKRLHQMSLIQTCFRKKCAGVAWAPTKHRGHLRVAKQPDAGPRLRAAVRVRRSVDRRATHPRDEDLRPTSNRRVRGG